MGNPENSGPNPKERETGEDNRWKDFGKDIKDISDENPGPTITPEQKELIISNHEAMKIKLEGLSGEERERAIEENKKEMDQALDEMERK